MPLTCLNPGRRMAGFRENHPMNMRILSLLLVTGFACLPVPILAQSQSCSDGDSDVESGLGNAMLDLTAGPDPSSPERMGAVEPGPGPGPEPEPEPESEDDAAHPHPDPTTATPSQFRPKDEDKGYEHGFMNRGETPEERQQAQLLAGAILQKLKAMNDAANAKLSTVSAKGKQLADSSTTTTTTTTTTMALLIVSGSGYGLSHEIASKVAAGLKGTHGLSEILHLHADKVPANFKVSNKEHKLCMLVNSVQMGAHNGDMIKFVNQHIAPLDAEERPKIAHMTVGLGPADLKEDPNPDRATVEQNYADWDKAVNENWAKRTSGHVKPDFWHPVAGSLQYTKYFFITRWIMKGISGSKGFMPTDTSKDWHYTDYDDVMKFANECVASVYGS